jgi:ketosteroid isomerase-like protein
MTEAKRLTDRVWTLVEAGRLDELSELIDADCDFKMPGMALRGRAALVEVLRAYRAAFPDLRHRVLHHVEAEGTIALELIVEGTHTGPMMTPQGAVPATGRQVVWESCDYIRVKGGRVASWHVYHDTVPFLTALGVLPAQPPR